MGSSKKSLKIDLNFKTDLGLVMTPPKTAQYIISIIGPIRKHDRILDPCVGPGVFVKKLIENGIDKNQIEAFDINPEYEDVFKDLGINFHLKDYLLSFSVADYNQYDIIIGNPPYLNKSSNYISKNKQSLQKIYGKINAHETYSMFIVASIWRLKPGGRLGFITSNSFLTLNTHTKLRRYILTTCKIKEICLAPKSLFDAQDVSTSTVIIILEKCSGKEKKDIRSSNMMRIIPRVDSEDDYNNPTKIHTYKQKIYHLLPFNIFFMDVEKEIIDMFEKSLKLEKYLKGYVGMHTHNNKRFIAAVENTELAEIFQKRNENIEDPNNQFKIITEEQLKSDGWKPYLKRGGADQYYRPIMEALDWDSNSIPIYDIPKNVPFGVEGIVISGVSSRLAARYMPKGCYWDSNKAIGFLIQDSHISIEYLLGLINSSFYNYLMKGIINNTNSIQITGINSLPFTIPDEDTKNAIEKLVIIIINKKREDSDYNFTKYQKEIDEIIFDFHQKQYRLPIKMKEKIDSKFSIYSD